MQLFQFVQRGARVARARHGGERLPQVARLDVGEGGAPGPGVDEPDVVSVRRPDVTADAVRALRVAVLRGDLLLDVGDLQRRRTVRLEERRVSPTVKPVRNESLTIAALGHGLDAGLVRPPWDPPTRTPCCRRRRRARSGS